MSSPLTLQWEHAALTSPPPHTHTHTHHIPPLAHPSPTLSQVMCVYQTHTESLPTESVAWLGVPALSRSCSVSNAVSLLLTLHKSPVISCCPGDSLLICSPAPKNVQVAAVCLISFLTWWHTGTGRRRWWLIIRRKVENTFIFLSERNYCSTLYTVYSKQSSGESLHVFAIPPPNYVYFEICLMLMMFAATKIHMSTDRGTKFLSLTRWDPQWRQHCWHSCGDLQKPMPGLQNEWDPHFWVWVHPDRLWGDSVWREHTVKTEKYCQTTKVWYQCEIFKGKVP